MRIIITITTLLLFVINLNSFTLVWLMTGGGPAYVYHPGITEIYNIADGSNAASVALAQGLADAIGLPPAPAAPASGQTAGSLFTLATRDFLEAAFQRVSHLRPGSWLYVTNPSEAAIAVFAQFDHLAEPRQFLNARRALETATGAGSVAGSIFTRRTSRSSGPFFPPWSNCGGC